jgi:CubicO group peptidase (beta-lactamase class C family)
LKKRTGRRLIFVLTSSLIIGATAFKLFEPALVYTSGWKRAPDGPYPLVNASSSGWTEAGPKAVAWLTKARADLNAPALSAAVSIDGERVWAGAVGFADLESRTEATLNTGFRIGSSSKAVTSVAMGILIDDGAVDLDAPISTYVRDVSAQLSSITVRQSMSHTAGVRDYGLCLCFPIWEYYNRRHYRSQREALGPFERSRLLFSPGENFFYSSYGYNIAGAVLEAVSTHSFGEFLERQVFEPLGMAATHVDSGEPMASDATFYEVEDGRGYKKTFGVDNTNKLPSGGILSTPSDMTRLGHQVIAPTMFSERTRDVLIRPQPLADGRPNPQGYALGWRRHEAKLLDGSVTTTRLHHHGVAYGAVSHLSVYPTYGVVVSIMMNKNSGSAGPLGEHAAGLTDLFVSAIKRDEP